MKIEANTYIPNSHRFGTPKEGPGWFFSHPLKHMLIKVKVGSSLPQDGGFFLGILTAQNWVD